MDLTIVKPTETLVEKTVERIFAEAIDGAFTILPRHREIVTVLVPGLIGYTDTGGREAFTAVDEGVLVKRDGRVTVSVVDGTGELSLSEVDSALDELFKRRAEREQRYRTAVTRLETQLARRFLEYERSEV